MESNKIGCIPYTAHWVKFQMDHTNTKKMAILVI